MQVVGGKYIKKCYTTKELRDRQHRHPTTVVDDDDDDDAAVVVVGSSPRIQEWLKIENKTTTMQQHHQHFQGQL